MARTCSNCGRQALDDQSRFCNKCGTPFSEEQPRKTVLVRTIPRLADAPPQPLQQPLPPLPPAEEPPAPPQYIREPPRIRVPPRPPAREPRRPAPVLPFKKFIAKDFIRPVYWLGVIAILLIVFSGITTGTTTAATTDNTSTDTTTKAPEDILAGIPLFWIGILVFANLLWRTVCETSAVLFALYESGTSTGPARNPERDVLSEDEMPDYGDADSGEFVSCPHCGKTVARNELRTCAHCGVEGCSNCIRMMGLVRKTLTCRDCYQKK